MKAREFGIHDQINYKVFFSNVENRLEDEKPLDVTDDSLIFNIHKNVHKKLAKYC
jgi:hypothetical protein